MSEHVPDSSLERIQKIIASGGIASRREAEKWISEGRISVNGKTAKLGDKISPRDRVALDGKVLQLVDDKAPEYRVIVYNKPEGEMCTRNDPEGRPTVFNRLPRLKSSRWVAVGRLDINTTGLLLLTTDGELANRLMHPSYGVDREYAVRIHGEVTDDVLQSLRDGVLLEDGMARFTDIKESGGEGSNHWYHVALMEGRNREVRRLWESQGVQVSRLKRVRYGCIFLPSRVRAGTWEELSSKDINQLRDLVGLDPIQLKQPSIKQIKKEERMREKLARNSTKRRPPKRRS